MATFFAAAAPVIRGVGSILTARSRRGAAKRAGTALADAGEVAKRDIFGASGAAQETLAEAGRRAPQAMYEATAEANRGLDPYRQTGEQGNAALAELARGGFKFNYADYANDPAFDFQMKKGTQAIANSAAARGLASSGNVLQGLTDYGQGLAATHYDQAFQRALKTFGTNVDVNDILAGRGERTTSEFGRNTIAAGRYAGDVGIRTAENQADVVTGAAREAGPYTTRIGEAQAGSGLAANANSPIGPAFNTLADLIAWIRGRRIDEAVGGPISPPPGAVGAGAPPLRAWQGPMPPPPTVNIPPAWQPRRRP